MKAALFALLLAGCAAQVDAAELVPDAEVDAGPECHAIIGYGYPCGAPEGAPSLYTPPPAPVVVTVAPCTPKQWAAAEKTDSGACR